MLTFKMFLSSFFIEVVASSYFSQKAIFKEPTDFVETIISLILQSLIVIKDFKRRFLEEPIAFFQRIQTQLTHFFYFCFRYIAVTQPIKYAKHKNNRRVWMTIALVWVISAAIGSPLVLGLNNTPDRVADACLFYNSDFIIYSSLSSFYIPCIIMVFLYYNIFKVCSSGKANELQ